jgi:hypothetical protein
MLESDANQGILNCSRQWGKSTVGAVKAVHRAYTRPGSLIVVASPSERQSAELVMKAAGMVEMLGIPARGDGSNKISLVFPNKSRIIGLPGSEGTVRGFSAVNLMLIDEASRVEDAIYMALRPMLATTFGDLWLMSTPYGRRGFFYEEWAHGGPDWKRVTATATGCSRIPAKFLERERERMGPMWFQQEFLCQFVDSGGGLFGREELDEAVSDEVKPLGGF